MAVHSPIHAIVKQAKLNDTQKQKLTKEVIKNMAEYSAKRKCEQGVEINTIFRLKDVPLKDIEAIGLKDRYTRRDDFLKGLKNKKAELELAFEKAHPIEDSIKENRFCTEDFIEGSLSKKSMYQRECNANIKHTFASNSSDIDIEALKGSEQYKRFNACLKKMKDDGFELRPSGIEISASSTQLNNNPTKSGFCPWDFKGLSKARAQNTKDMILKNYGYKPEDIRMSFNGRNRNGSSGPCPYIESNGRRVLMDKYKRNKDQLEDHRYVNVKALFEPKVTAYNKKESYYKYTKSCVAIGYKCRDTWNPKVAREKEFIADRFIP